MSETKTIERPILFSGPMVRAILGGSKTQTRRIVKPQPVQHIPATNNWPGEDLWTWEKLDHANGSSPGVHASTAALKRMMIEKCPHGKPGDQLWVREAWATQSSLHMAPALYSNNAIYRADTHAGLEKKNGDQKWRPSIHMPRWASRITLEITEIRVERLQDINGEDAKDEGAECRTDLSWAGSTDESFYPHGFYGEGNIAGFKELWQSTNGPESWNANPWVWVVSFKKVAP